MQATAMLLTQLFVPFTVSDMRENHITACVDSRVNYCFTLRTTLKGECYILEVLNNLGTSSAKCVKTFEKLVYYFLLMSYFVL